MNSDHCWVINPQFEDAESFSDGLARVLLSDKFGFIDRTGKMVIKPQFEHADSFSEGLAPVRLGGKKGFIDRTGKMVINPQFAYGWEDEIFGIRFSDGLTRVSLGDKDFKINRAGQILLDPTCTAKRGNDDDSLMDKVRGWFSK